MKNMWTLSNYFFSWMMKRGAKGIILCGMIFGFVNLLANAFPRAATAADRSHLAEAFRPYEGIIDGSGIPTFFVLGLVCLLLQIFWHAKSYYMNGKGVYTLLTLPMKRERIYLSFLFSALAVILLYFMAWLALILAAYVPVMANHANAAAEEIFYVTPQITVKGLDAVRTNGLYLAFQRSSFLYTAFPIDPVRLLALVGGLLLILTSLLFAALHHGEPLAAAAVGIVGLGFGVYAAASPFLWKTGLAPYSIYAATLTGKAFVAGIVCLILTGTVIALSLYDMRKKYAL